MKWIVLVMVAACSGGSHPSTTAHAVPSDAAAADAAPALTGIGAALDVTPRDATVTIDDIVMGRANELDPVVALAPGLHTLVIAQPGFKSYRAEFSVTDKVEKFVVKLERN
jgi:hypothetical protein